MTTATLPPSLKNYILRIFTSLVSIVLLLLPANPDNVNLTVEGKGQGTDSFFGYPYCLVSVQMENKTNRKMEKPDYAVLEKDIEGEWIYVSKGNIPEEDHWIMMHGGKTTETFYFFLENETDFSPGKYRITVHYDVRSLTSKAEGKSSAVFTVS